jgi:hypothetical protein
VLKNVLIADVMVASRQLAMTRYALERKQDVVDDINDLQFVVLIGFKTFDSILILDGILRTKPLRRKAVSPDNINDTSCSCHNSYLLSLYLLCRVLT